MESAGQVLQPKALESKRRKIEKELNWKLTEFQISPLIPLQIPFQYYYPIILGRRGNI